MENRLPPLGYRKRYVAMGHEIVIFGCIQGVAGETGALKEMQLCNELAICELPLTDDWPWLTQPMFAFSRERPIGFYLTQVFHFGLSMKDGIPLNQNEGYKNGYDPILNWRNSSRDSITNWMAKFEALLRNMYWYGADVHVETDFEPRRLFTYELTGGSLDAMLKADCPIPVKDWKLSVVAT